MGGVTTRRDWLGEIRGQIVALDTAPLIYYIEEHPLYLPHLDPFFEAIDRGEIRVVTSTVTLMEVLVQPLQRGNFRVVERYRKILLDVAGLRTVPVTTTVAEEAARLRAAHRLAPPDAFQLATAITEGATAILTNDLRLPRLASLPLLILDEL